MESRVVETFIHEFELCVVGLATADVLVLLSKSRGIMLCFVNFIHDECRNSMLTFAIVDKPKDVIIPLVVS